MTATIETSAGPIDVDERGSGTPVVLLHPFMTNGLHWRKVADALERDARCIMPTLPIGSHRMPMRPDADLSPPGIARVVIDVMDGLGIDRAIVVGNDTGGAIAQIVGTSFPDRVSGLGLVSCDAYDVFPPKMFGYLKLAAATRSSTWLLARSMSIPGVVRLPIAYGWVTEEPLPREVLGSYIGPVQRNAAIRRDLMKVVKGLDPVHTQRAAEELRTFPHPVVLAWGERDRVFPRRLAERLERDIPDATLTLIEGARTFVPEDAPELLAAALRKLL